MIQHRNLRYIFNDYSYTSSVSSMLSELNLPTLVKWRKNSSLVMLYKIHHNLVRIPLHHDIQPSLRQRFTFPFSRINPHMYSFSPVQLDSGTTSHLTYVLARTSEFSEQGFSTPLYNQSKSCLIIHHYHPSFYLLYLKMLCWFHDIHMEFHSYIIKKSKFHLNRNVQYQ